MWRLYCVHSLSPHTLPAFGMQYMHWLHHMCVCNVYIQINHSVTCVSCLSVTWCLYVCHLPSQYIFCRFTCVMQNVLSARAGYQRQFSHRRANGTKPFFCILVRCLLSRIRAKKSTYRNTYLNICVHMHISNEHECVQCTSTWKCTRTCTVLQHVRLYVNMIMTLACTVREGIHKHVKTL